MHTVTAEMHTVTAKLAYSNRNFDLRRAPAGSRRRPTDRVGRQSQSRDLGRFLWGSSSGKSGSPGGYVSSFVSTSAPVPLMARHRYRQSQYVGLTRLQLDEIGRERDLQRQGAQQAEARAERAVELAQERVVPAYERL